MILRDDLDVAVNDLLIALREAADAYATAAAIAAETPWSAFFTKARDDLEVMAARVEKDHRAAGYLPKQPDPEQALVRDAATHLKAALAAEAIPPLLEERRQGEQQIAALAEQVIELAAPNDLLSTARQAIERSKKRLRQLEARPSAE